MKLRAVILLRHSRDAPQAGAVGVQLRKNTAFILMSLVIKKKREKDKSGNGGEIG